MFFYFVVITCSFLITFLTLYYLTKRFYDHDITNKKILVATRIRWGDSNKSHLGGLSFSISIFLINILILIFFKNIYLYNFNELFFFSSVILLSGFFGFLDEKYSCKPIEKIILQILISTLLIIIDFKINFSSNELINIFITLLYYVAMFNILNMFDNIDLGLTSICIPIIIFFLFFSNINIGNKIILLIMLSSLIAFSYYNFYPSKIFMGDIGSFQLAVLLSASSVNIFWSEYQFQGYINSIYSLGLQNIIFLLPIVDFIIVTIERLLKGKSIFTGDANHISHIFNFRIKKVNLLSLVFAIIVIVLMFSFYLIDNHLIPGKHSLLILIFFYLLFFGLIYYLYILSKNE